MTARRVMKLHVEYWIGDKNLGSIEIDSWLECSRHFLCTRCGDFYGKKVVTPNQFENSWSCWAGTCPECKPTVPNACPPGGIPFFRLDMDNYPPDVIAYQLQVELEAFYVRHAQETESQSSGVSDLGSGSDGLPPA